MAIPEPNLNFTGCIGLDLYKGIPKNVVGPLREIILFLNEQQYYFDGRTQLIEAFFEGDEWTNLFNSLANNVIGEDFWTETEVVDGKLVVRHVGRNTAPIDHAAGVIGQVLEQVILDAQNHVLDYISVPAPGGGDNYWWCYINDADSHADEEYFVTELQPLAAGGYQVMPAGGIGTVVARNFAEEEAGSHLLTDLGLPDPRVVIVTMKEDDAGNPVYGFQRPLVLWRDVPYEGIFAIGAEQSSALEYFASSAAGVISDRRMYFKFAGAPIDQHAIGAILMHRGNMMTHTVIDGCLVQVDFVDGDALTLFNAKGIAFDLMGAFALADFNGPVIGVEPALTAEFVVGNLGSANIGGPAIVATLSPLAATPDVVQQVYGVRLRWVHSGAYNRGGSTLWWEDAYFNTPSTDTDFFLSARRRL